MKYNVGDKVKIKSLDWYNRYTNGTEVNCKYKFFPFSSYMKKYCGQIMTISVVGGDLYHMIEDNGLHAWTDDMFECKVEEETKSRNNMCKQLIDEMNPNVEVNVKVKTKPEPKFKVGDKITNGKDNLTILHIISDKYIVDDNLGEWCILYFNNQDYWKIVEEESIIDLTVKGEEIKERIEIAIPEGYEYVIESGKIIFTKTKKPYPKTYEECEKILGLEDSIIEGCLGYEYKLLNAFQKLFMCRNAYWKIAGEEMGLGEPWEPDYKNPNIDLYVIINIYNRVEKAKYGYGFQHCTFSFPTPEMRDAFKENFKGEIEKCKELL